MVTNSLYIKNVPPLERLLRILVALVVLGVALLRLPAPWSYLTAVASIGISLTGLLGYCPACAMVGRRI